MTEVKFQSCTIAKQFSSCSFFPEQNCKRHSGAVLPPSQCGSSEHYHRMDMHAVTKPAIHQSSIIIQGYADRDDIPDNPSLNLTSTSSVLIFPTNVTNGSLYWRILARDVAGTPCAQESAVLFYYLDANGEMTCKIYYIIIVSPLATVFHANSSDGVGCVPIPVGPRRDYSSLEVVWPERRDTVGRLCYCGLHLRGNIISSLDAYLPHHVTQTTP